MKLQRRIRDVTMAYYCGRCGAQPHRACTSANGTPSPDVHRARYDAWRNGWTPMPRDPAAS